MFKLMGLCLNLPLRRTPATLASYLKTVASQTLTYHRFDNLFHQKYGFLIHQMFARRILCAHQAYCRRAIGVNRFVYNLCVATHRFCRTNRMQWPSRQDIYKALNTCKHEDYADNPQKYAPTIKVQISGRPAMPEETLSGMLPT